MKFMKKIVPQNNKRRIILLVIFVLVFLSLLIPYELAATYANPAEDDFSNMNAVLGAAGSNFLVKGWNQAYSTYMNWQGSFFGNFLTFAGSGIYYKYHDFGLHLEFMLNILLMFIAVLYLSYAIFKRVFSDSDKELIRILAFAGADLAIFMILRNFDVGEVFYWHTGLCMYTVPISLTLIAIGLLLDRSSSVWKIIIASSLSFLAAGGSLDISAFCCSVTLLISFYRMLLDRKFHPDWIVFLAGFLGSIVNVAGPGNYVRHARFSNQFPIWNSLKFSFAGAFTNFWSFFSNGTIVLLLILCIALFDKLKTSQFKFCKPWLLSILLLLCSIIIDFPVYLGYASPTYFPPRCLLVRQVSMVLFIMLIMIDAFGWVAQKTDNKLELNQTGILKLLLAGVLSVGLWMPTDSWNSVTPFRIYTDLMYGNLRAYENTNLIIVNQLQAGKNQDVTIHVPSYDTMGYMHGIGLTSDSSFWVNTSVASYFGDKSVVLTVGQ